MTLVVVAALVIVAACGFGAFMMSRDSETDSSQNVTTTSSVEERDISSQTVDPEPLTEAELFPETTLTLVEGEGAYTVLKTQITDDCTAAATDDLATMLANQGCTQVVRATLSHPTGTYVITAGVFNLTDEAAAEAARNNVKEIIDAQTGRFNGLVATGAEAIVKASTQLGWNTTGHYLAYCVIARADGEALSSDDGYPAQIIFDLVDTYLLKDALGKRRIAAPSAATPATASADASAT